MTKEQQFHHDINRISMQAAKDGVAIEYIVSTLEITKLNAFTANFYTCRTIMKDELNEFFKSPGD